jgi:hypothetical protein
MDLHLVSLIIISYDNKMGGITVFAHTGTNLRLLHNIGKWVAVSVGVAYGYLLNTT